MHKRSMSSVHKCDIKSDHAALIITDFCLVLNNICSLQWLLEIIGYLFLLSCEKDKSLKFVIRDTFLLT